MPKWLRLSLRIGLGCLAGLALISVLCVDGVDYRSYLRAPYFAEANAKLQAESSGRTLARGPLSAGFGRALLSPHLNDAQPDAQKGQFASIPLAGYGDRHGKPAQGTHDDVYVKAVALRVGDRLGVMIGVDALIIPAEVTDLLMPQLEAQFKLSREQVYLSATHTHSSLGGWGKGMVEEAFAGGFRPGVRVWFAQQIVSAVRDALADLKPASLGQGRFPAPEFIRNRLIGRLGRVDPEFSYAVVKQTNGKLAVLGSYSAHATVLSGNQMQFSADYPGAWQRDVEHATGGLAVFLAGGVGSHSPVPPATGFAGVERMGEALAEKLLTQLPQVRLTNEVTFGMMGLEFSLPPTNVRLTDGLRLRPWLARRLVPVRPTTFLQAFRLQDQVWLSTPCDFSGEMALGIKEDLSHRGLHAVVTSFNGDYIGYVIPLKYYHLDGYEPRTMSFFGPNVPDMFDDLLLSLAHDVSP